MPTKHKRKRGNNNDNDKTHYDLPSTSRARSLPVIAPTRGFLTARSESQAHPYKRRRLIEKKNADDTPKNFARLMAWHTQGKKLAPGLDNGDSSNRATKKKKDKKQNTSQAQTQEREREQGRDLPKTTSSKARAQPQAEYISADATTTANRPLKILPGESLAEFNFRVDQSLPLSGGTKTSTNTKTTTSTPNSLPADLRIKSRLTKHNKRLSRMQADWRATETRLRAKEEERDEEDEERREEEKLLWQDVKLVGGKKKRKINQDADDPWKELERKRRGEGITRQKDIRDVVLEPPVLNVRGVKNIFKKTSHNHDYNDDYKKQFVRQGGSGRERRGSLRV